MKKVGFVGLGVMGTAMAQNLLKAGFDVFVWARHPEKAQPVLDKGAHWCATLAECASGRDAVITIVGFPQDVREVYFGEGGILENADKGTLLIDMTTTSPRLSVEIHQAAVQKGLRAVDAPVSGGDTGAKNATLSIMMGGDKEDCEACRPLFEAMGKTIVYEGPAGSGQHTKAANQIALGGAIAGLAGSVEVMGTYHRLYDGFSPGYGFDGIPIALLANGNPIGIIIGSILFAALRVGSLSVQLEMGVSSEIVSVIQGILIVLIACEYILKYAATKLASRKKG